MAFGQAVVCVILRGRYLMGLRVLMAALSAILTRGQPDPV